MNSEKNVVTGSELEVLKYLDNRNSSSFDSPITEIGEIVTRTGVKDNDEVLRALYTLQGKDLVQPEPAGDFTSDQWKITNHGAKALQHLELS